MSKSYTQFVTEAKKVKDKREKLSIGSKKEKVIINPDMKDVEIKESED